MSAPGGKRWFWRLLRQPAERSPLPAESSPALEDDSGPTAVGARRSTGCLMAAWSASAMLALIGLTVFGILLQGPPVIVTGRGVTPSAAIAALPAPTAQGVARRAEPSAAPSAVTGPAVATEPHVPLPAPSPVLHLTATTVTKPSTPQAVANADANLRAGPGTNYPIVGRVGAGQALAIKAKTAKGDWYALVSHSWIFAELVTGAPEVPVTDEIPPPPSPTATLAPARNTSVPARNTSVPRPAQTHAPAAPPTTAPADPLPFCKGKSGQPYGAVCNDGSSTRSTGQGACNQHGGVASWLLCP